MSKTILIVGGSHGITEALCDQLSAAGHHVLTANRSGSGDNHQSYDATSGDSLDVPDQLDGLVYAPGSITLKPFHRLTQDDMLDEFKLNALGAASAVQQCLPALKKSPAASVVLFSTVAVQTGLPFHASIAMAKGAVEGLTRSLAAELAPKIRVNAIAPSLTDTPLAENLVNSEAKRKASAERHPLAAIGNPEDVAALAKLLLSEESKFITGQVLHVDGGLGRLRPL
ncbi:SDR family NAD(P)-dependent oxidoreductase [Sulfuriroseicoccus oceanibius]|uniref:SDR family oxidoreductase n=1 Tax=Sulfuriroseicoccus oceanibius TaxID=2707525 RepID=A0A6B3LBU7_9BACT|nr:SDR family oxidoreductase [Sulfuriroseicoccus oceanibius]QQL45280.1 SDR family oxidoreductase [Sulfuriroseicoccus oceanibius]